MRTPSFLQSHWRRRSCRAVALLCVVGGLAAGLAMGAEPDDSALIQIEARFVRATDAQMRKAFGSFGVFDPKAGVPGVLTPDQAEKALRTLARCKADFFSSPRAVCRSGERAVVEATREMRYPTEFKPAQGGSGKVVPAAFESRNTGVTLECEASAKDDDIQMSMTAKVVTFLGFIDYALHNSVRADSGPRPMAELLKRRLTAHGIWQPVFSDQRVSSSLDTKSGYTVVLGGFFFDSLEKELGDNRRNFVFIKVRILPANNGAGHPVSP
jgi:hypothetical protein